MCEGGDRGDSGCDRLGRSGQRVCDGTGSGVLGWVEGNKCVCVHVGGVVCTQYSPNVKRKP